MAGNSKLRVAVLGATGYAGAELVRILCGHPGVELSMLTSRQYAGTTFSKVYPAFAGICDQVLETYDPDRAAKSWDVAFTCLPHKLPMGIVPGLLDRGGRVVDLSADFRFQSRERYEAHYQPHAAPEILARAVYGLTEINRDAVSGAELVGNPGCYPTCSLLPLAPFVKQELVDLDSIVIDAKSGVSGAGRGLAVGSLFCEVSDSFRAYKVASHRHEPEIEEVLSNLAGRDVAVTFVPHLVPMNRGMLSTIYAKLTSPMDEDQARAVAADFYAESPFVRVKPVGELPRTSDVRNTNFCDMAVKTDAHTGRLVLVSVIDNLVKGAAGQAVQNMNVMFGLPETQGLGLIPGPV
ncbi:MAG: N-acetyl-gamma-glutamyl-phosphate reductase [Proteobacteria bacterium]|nr:N-acetyl-gamma-glutamyl-phosphate reductase [Pseudomonadota bacterium]